MTAKVYCRISLDSGEIKGAGVERQEQDCRKYATANGLTVGEVYIDNSVSAYGGKERPEWERLKKDLSKGDTVLAYDSYRIGRNAVEQLSFIEDCHKKGITVITVVDNTILTDPQQSMMVGVRAIVAQEESRKLGERVARAKRQTAESGKPLASRFRTFGYTRDFEPVPDEAKVVKEMFDRVAKGHSVHSIYKWIASLYPVNPVTDKKFGYNTVNQMIQNARYAGLNVYRGEIIGEGTQPPLITRTVWDACQERKKERKGKIVPAGNNARSSLLVGFIYCSECFSVLRVHNAGSGQRSYLCSSDNGGCGKVSMKQEWVDESITNALVVKYAFSNPIPAQPVEDFTEQVKEAETKVEEIREAFSNGDLEMADMLPMLNAARANLRKLEDKNRAAAKAAVVAQGFPLIKNIKAFKDADLSQQRATISDHIKTIVLSPSTKRRTLTADLHRIEVHWQDGEVENLGVTDDAAREYDLQANG